MSSLHSWLLAFPSGFLSWVSYTRQLPLSVRVIGAMLFVLTLIFVVIFLCRGLLLRFKLSRLLWRLRKIAPTTANFEKIFSLDKTLSHLWREYSHTLQKQFAVDPRTGSQDLIAIRGTSSADTFFNSHSIVDNRLRTEFFKHLPGICTGLGIIGTFLGLIQGLSAFQVSENVQQIQASVQNLLHGVFEAFLVSAAAITIAMSITLIEKWLISSLYQATERLVHRLDALFEAGANTEYLERLVKASEDTATQGRILKDALVSDLKQILSDLTRQQIQASSTESAQLGQRIIAGIQSGLSEPLSRIAGAVDQAGQNQGQAVTSLLTDVLAGFSQRLEEFFGTQTAGINQLQQQAVQSLQTAVEKLDQMASNIDAAGRAATGSMAGTLSEAISAIDMRLKNMNEQMSGFVSRIGESTTSTVDKMGSGTDILNAAIGEFSKATQELTNVLSGTATTAATLTQAAGSMTAASRTLDSIVGDYRTNRDVLDRMLTELRTIVESAKKESSLTNDILTRIDSAATKLSHAQLQAEQYLDKISEVLTEAHQEFSDNMRRTLGEANRQFYDQLTQATGLLRAGIQDFEATLATFDPKK